MKGRRCACPPFCEAHEDFLFRLNDWSKLTPLFFSSNFSCAQTKVQVIAINTLAQLAEELANRSMILILPQCH